MTPHEFVRLVRGNVLVLVVGLIVGLSGGLILSINQRPMYVATAKAFVSVQQAANASDLSQGNAFTQQVVQSYADIIATPAVLNSVIRNLKLDMSAAELAPYVSASAAPGTVVLDISARSTSPVTAASISNAAASSLISIVPNLTPSATSASAIKVSVVQQATAPAAPESPNIPMNVLIGSLVGLLGALALAVMRDVLDVRVRSEHDVESVGAVPVLGNMPYAAEAYAHPLITDAQAKGARAEAFKSLRTNLAFVNGGEGVHSLVVTSSIPQEGKSTTSANLAIAMAQAGQKVLVVDADLRRPKLATYFAIDGAIGLTDILIGDADVGQAIQSWGEYSLHILPAGRVPPNPSELLAAGRMRRLLAELETEYDVVLIDAPPLLPVSDAAILSTYVTGALVIASVRKVRRPHLAHALQALTRVSAVTLGVVLTMSPRKSPDSYNYAYGFSDDE